MENLQKEDDPDKVLLESPLVSVPDASNSSWQAMARYYNRAWFTRVWVIQELQACLDVWVSCGGFTIEWEFVPLAAAWALFAVQDIEIEQILWDPEGLQQASTMRERLATRRDIPFLLALDRAQSFSSTVPRDKVFSMLQHEITPASDSVDEAPRSPHPRSDVGPSPLTDCRVNIPHLGIQANYDMNTSDVYREVAVRSIRRYDSLGVLDYVDSTHARASEQPSWIPRWDSKYTATLLHHISITLINV